LGSIGEHFGLGEGGVARAGRGMPERGVGLAEVVEAAEAEGVAGGGVAELDEDHAAADVAPGLAHVGGRQVVDGAGLGVLCARAVVLGRGKVGHGAGFRVCGYLGSF